MRVLTWCLLLYSLLFLASCRESRQPSTLSRIGNDTGLVLPAGARVAEFSVPERSWGSDWVAKIIIPASSYKAFEQSVIAKPVDTGTVRGALSESTSWWKPTQVLLKRQYLQGSQTLVNVVVAKEGEEIAVYIECIVF